MYVCWKLSLIFVYIDYASADNREVDLTDIQTACDVSAKLMMCLNADKMVDT